MPTKALKKFGRTIRRCKELLRVYRSLISIKEDAGGKVRRMIVPKDLIRSSVVLSVSALDAYVTDAFSEKLVPYIKRYTPDKLMIDILKEAGLDTTEALKLIKMERPYRRIRTLIEKYYARHTTQKFEVIDNLFLAYRLKNITGHAQNKVRRKTLKRSVELLIERRHKIAHEGDYNSHGKLNSINHDRIKKRIADLELLITCMDEIICNKIV